jgi:DNA-binding response OmpR family regulator
MPADQPTVLLVEDEPAQREVLGYNLEADGFRVLMASNGEEALMMVAEMPPDIIVLDWMMPNVSGIEVCRQLKTRSETRGIPIIMLSARSEEVDRVRGLETGADDYVVKPYSLVELMARVRAQLRRTRPASVGERLEYKDIVLDSETYSSALDLHGEAGARLVARAIARPGLGARYLCRYAHRGCAYRAAQEGIVPAWRRGSAAHRARRGLCTGIAVIPRRCAPGTGVIRSCRD